MDATKCDMELMDAYGPTRERCVLTLKGLPYSPQQNGKQENFWTRVEGRLMPMLEGEPELTLELLNRATTTVSPTPATSGV